MLSCVAAPWMHVDMSLGIPVGVAELHFGGRGALRLLRIAKTCARGVC
jgi:hypothetical protein